MSTIVSVPQVGSSPSWPGERTAGRANAAKPAQGATTGELSAEALAVIAKLKLRDAEVRQHEQAHLASAGSLALSGASYTYQRGPDGVNYAVGGEVQIDTSPGRTAEETVARARTVVAAALAPADPSGADRAVAAQALQLAAEAQAELALEKTADPDQVAQRAPDPLAELVRRAYGTAEARPATINITA